MKVVFGLAQAVKLSKLDFVNFDVFRSIDTCKQNKN
jgi:hypothetical protein